MKNTGYFPADMSLWRGRTDNPSDADTFRFHQVVKPLNLSLDNQINGGKPLCLLGFKSDEGVRRNKGRTGAFGGSDAIRVGLASLPWHFDGVTLYDCGDVVCGDGRLEEAQAMLSAMVTKICEAGGFPIVLGGGHEVALGHYTGLKNHYIEGKLGIINFDAHFDIRPYNEQPSSGTMFAQIADNTDDFRYLCLGIQKTGNTKALFKTAEEKGVRYIIAEELSRGGDTSELYKFIDDCDRIYMTLCFDVISSAFAPGVSAVQPFGLHPETVRKIMSEILFSGKVAGFDIAEVAPELDNDMKTSKLAAHIIFYLIEQIAERN